MEEMVPEPDEVQRAEIERLTRLLFEKAARLNMARVNEFETIVHGI
jgi:hypothetical protein